MARPRVLIVGGGIAGVGVGWALGGRADVLLVEQERHLAHHTTGRSAALYIPSYGAPNLVALSRAGAEFFAAPPPHLADHSLVSPRGALFLAATGDLGVLDTYYDAAAPNSPGITRIDVEGAVARCPAIRADAFEGAIWEPLAQDIDVAALHQAFVRGIRRDGGEIRTSSPLRRLGRTTAGWVATVGDTTAKVDLVINAAGAWGDVVAAMAGVAPLGLRPLRRTAFMVTGPEESAGWPLVGGVSWDWYFKPDGHQLLCSPADVTPMEPQDVRPDEIDIAMAIDRINSFTTLGIRSVRSSWAGLRTFTPDDDIAIGQDPEEPSFFWLVGQGGDGIQSSPGASQLAAALALGEDVPNHIIEAGIDPAAVLPERFARR
jgi:D-arginine dehydrogenase